MLLVSCNKLHLHPKTPPRLHTLASAAVKLSPLLAAMVVLTTSRGYAQIPSETFPLGWFGVNYLTQRRDPRDMLLANKIILWEIAQMLTRTCSVQHRLKITISP